MELHPRHQIVALARNALARRVLDWIEAEGADLTYAETVAALTHVANDWAWGNVRAEREPRGRHRAPRT